MPEALGNTTPGQETTPSAFCERGGCVLNSKLEAESSALNSAKLDSPKLGATQLFPNLLGTAELSTTKTYRQLLTDNPCNGNTEKSFH